MVGSESAPTAAPLSLAQPLAISCTATIAHGKTALVQVEEPDFRVEKQGLNLIGWSDIEGELKVSRRDQHHLIGEASAQGASVAVALHATAKGNLVIEVNHGLYYCLRSAADDSAIETEHLAAVRGRWWGKIGDPEFIQIDGGSVTWDQFNIDRSTKWNGKATAIDQGPNLLVLRLSGGRADGKALIVVRKDADNLHVGLEGDYAGVSHRAPPR